MVKGIFTIVCIALSLQTLAQGNRTKNLIIVTLDGLRWQEVFNGADPDILFEKRFVSDHSVRDKFWSPVSSERRVMLMPFLWNIIGKHGQIYGNRTYNNRVDCANPHWFSYPGYSEMLLGFVDSRIKSNDPIENPSPTVLDFIQAQPGFENRVATFATWNMIEEIACENSSAFEVNAGNQPAKGNVSEAEALLNQLQPFIKNPHGERYDAFTFFYAFEYLKRSCPRVMFISFDETDEHAHGARYDEYLKSAHNIDKMIGVLWQWVQSQGDYKDQITIVITTDHGRGNGAHHSWKKHGRLAFGSDQIWLAVIGPDTPALGEMKTNTHYYQKQIAKTAAAFLGLNYSHVKPVGSIITPMIDTQRKILDSSFLAYPNFVENLSIERSSSLSER
jgi:hypothetical protein